MPDVTIKPPAETDAAELLRWVAARERVSVSVESLARGLKVDPDDPAALAGLRRTIADLVDSGDLCEWIGPTGKDLVCLTPGSACLFGLRPNRMSSKWLRGDRDEPPPKNRARQAVDGSRVVCETDMSEEPPGALANMPDRRTEVVDDPDYDLARILADERRLGLVRPTLPLVGVKPWTAEDWERDHDVHGKPFPGGGYGPVPKGGKPPCPVCQGRELRAMVSLAPVRVGRNRAMRPPAVVEGGEYCCRCGAHFQSDKWPKVVRLAAEPKGKASR